MAAVNDVYDGVVIYPFTPHHPFPPLFLPSHPLSPSRTPRTLPSIPRVLAIAAFQSTSAMTPVLLFTECRPPPNLFRCRDLVMHEGPIWLYHVASAAMRERLQPIGSCQLAHPTTLAEVGRAEGGAQEGRDAARRIGEAHEAELVEAPEEARVLARQMLESRTPRESPRAAPRVAYASVLHTTEDYVCGAIVLARSLKKSGTKADLVLLVSREINRKSRRGLKKAGWRLKEIERIRNPRAVPKSYNEWNYSKLRLWQLEEYDKVIFVDSDVLVLKNLDFLFSYPELSARGNARHLFNSGVMVLEPSNCTFNLFMSHVTTLTSCNGGDQGFLNNVFAWWHRLPESVSMLKYSWNGDTGAGGTAERAAKRAAQQAAQRAMLDRVFSAEPARVHGIHYLGRKPWQCYRDFDCTWLYPWDHQYVSDAAHARWWAQHDLMRPSLQEYCWLPNSIAGFPTGALLCVDVWGWVKMVQMGGHGWALVGAARPHARLPALSLVPPFFLPSTIRRKAEMGFCRRVLKKEVAPPAALTYKSPLYDPRTALHPPPFPSTFRWKAEMEYRRRVLKKEKAPKAFWNFNITDPRRDLCVKGQTTCNWRGYLRHWKK
ncbi:unnamed protein product [Closterium sp. NIES-64]|nr:unnamed protein product [Closterium sp. NIES-64]